MQHIQSIWTMNEAKLKYGFIVQTIVRVYQRIDWLIVDVYEFIKLKHTLLVTSSGI